MATAGANDTHRGKDIGVNNNMTTPDRLEEKLIDKIKDNQIRKRKST